jgi:sec-independent protein translocase protein TatC
MRLRAQRASSIDELTVVEHLDELRTRIIASAAVLVVAVGLAFWQNGWLLEIANAPLPDGHEPLTFGVSEPFFTTVKLSFYAGILLAMPVLLYQACAYILPAFSDRERRAVLPFLVMVPALFVAGVVFAYYVVLPPALSFLLNFNADDFNIQVRASEYYSFFMLTEISVGLLFQIPVGILAVTRLGLITPRQLARNRRYALLVVAIIAMLLPGTDPVTMLLCMLPLYVLFELSILLARAFGARGSELEDEPAPAGGVG